MGRYGASELMRNKNLQKKNRINKLTPFIQDSVGTAMDQLSTKVRPDIKYKTDRLELDGRTGGGIDVHNGLENSQDQKRDGPQENINTWGGIILSINNCVTILKLEK